MKTKISLKRILVVLFIMMGLFSSSVAQNKAEFSRLVKFYSNIKNFDYNYPREKVYLHLDNYAYIEGETMWFKAYVVRASSLEPTTLSRVLYVELLDASGELVERKVLRVDNGQANGEFKLDLPVKNGYYEVRAYTREMINWGEEACFSRVVPVFREPQEAGDYSKLEITRPQDATDLSPSHPRKYDFSKSGGCKVEFYPEGGNRVAGVAQMVAFRMTDRKGVPMEGKGKLYAENGTPIADVATLHEGIGTFLLPADAGSKPYLQMENGGKEQFFLPQPGTGEYAMTIQRAEGLDIIVQRRQDVQPHLLAVVVTCRDQVCYFDTLTVGAEPVALEIDYAQLGDGVNRVELFDYRGHSLASRFVFHRSDARKVSMEVKQNAKVYDPFSPVALEMKLKDASGKPVETTFSLAVRENNSNLVGNPEEDICTDLLLSSELKGYIHNPQYYFENEDPERVQALDALLMVQGWTANSLEVQNGLESFNLKQPVEDQLIINGRVLKDNDKEQARAGAKLSLNMFAKDGSVLKSECITDSVGGFAFASSVDYMGDWVAQFSTKVDDKLKWSRVALDRWFGVNPRTFDSREFDLKPTEGDDDANVIAMQNAVNTFAWKDTIPVYSSGGGNGFDDGVAVVKAKKRYKGLRGDRYSYKGGEKAGMEHADIYYNIEAQVERAKDEGKSVNLIWDVLAEKDRKFDYMTDLDTNDKHYMGFLRSIGDTVGTGISNLETYTFRYSGHPCMIFIDNELFMQRKKGDTPIIFADEVKSVVIMKDREDWDRFSPEIYSARVGDDLSNYNPIGVFIYTRPDFKYFRSKKGVEKRSIHGYVQPKLFYSPSYHGIDKPVETDLRRTLYWNPNVQSDASGKATAVFFSNANRSQTLRISARGVTQGGGILNFEQ